MHIRTAAIRMIVAGLITGTASARSVIEGHAAPHWARAEPVPISAQRAGGARILQAASSELARLRVPRSSLEVSLVRVQPAQSRSWIGRHPVISGTLVGFGGGFLIGYLPGDDAVFDDGAAGFNGMVIGGVGAGTGAAIGAFVGAGR